MVVMGFAVLNGGGKEMERGGGCVLEAERYGCGGYLEGVPVGVCPRGRSTREMLARWVARNCRVRVEYSSCWLHPKNSCLPQRARPQSRAGRQQQRAGSLSPVREGVSGCPRTLRPAALASNQHTPSERTMLNVLFLGRAICFAYPPGGSASSHDRNQLHPHARERPDSCFAHTQVPPASRANLC